MKIIVAFSTILMIPIYYLLTSSNVVWIFFLKGKKRISVFFSKKKKINSSGFKAFLGGSFSALIAFRLFMMFNHPITVTCIVISASRSGPVPVLSPSGIEPQT